MQRPLKQGPFYYTGLRVFRVSSSSFKEIYKGVQRFSEEDLQIIGDELIDGFIETYSNDLGRSLQKTSATGYEIRIFSQKGNRFFTIGFDYLEERGKTKISSSLYYLQVSFIV